MAAFAAGSRGPQESCQGEAPRPLAGRNLVPNHPTPAATVGISHPNTVAVSWWPCQEGRSPASWQGTPPPPAGWWAS